MASPRMKLKAALSLVVASGCAALVTSTLSACRPSDGGGDTATVSTFATVNRGTLVTPLPITSTITTGGGTPAVIANLNGSTDPASPTGVSIEINGTGFGASPGTVTFQEGTSAPIVVTPAGSAWSNTNILVTVPTGLTAPGTASLFVTTSGGGISGVLTFNVTVTPTFSPSGVTWAATTPLPTPLRAHASVAVLATTTSSAWVYVLGGNDGSATVNTNTVLFASLDSTGAVGSWTATNPLPATVAFLAAAQASSTNSPVPTGSAFIYAIGGQAAASDTPGGTTTVFVGTVNLATGGVTWAAGTSLPETRVGARAAVVNGFLHVTGGLSGTGTAIGATASAPILSSGALGSFAEVSTVPVAAAFHESFAFNGELYVIAGDLGPQSTPFSVASSMATTNTWKASIRAGVVGSWNLTFGTIKAREKGALLVTSGQLMVYEGSYGSTTTEGESSAVQSSGALTAFGAQTGAALPGLNTFNGSGVSSPVVTATNTPRFLLIGGDSVVTPGTLTASVLQTTAP